MSKDKIRVLPLPKLWECDLGDHVIDLKWSPNGMALAAASIAGPITVRRGSDGSSLAEWDGHFPGTLSIDWHPSETVLATGGQDSQVVLWDIVSGERKSFKTGKSWVESVRWSRDGQFLAVAAGKKVLILDRRLNPVKELPDHPSTVTDLIWHPSKNELAATAYGGPKIWSLEETEPLLKFDWAGASLKLAWSADGKYIATADQTPTVHFWNLEKKTDLQMSGYEGKVKALSWNFQSRYLATGGGSSGVVWDCSGPKGPEGSTPIMLEAHFKPITALAYQHRSGLLVSGSLDTHFYVWWPDRSPDPLLHRKLAGGASQVAWSPDDQTIALASETGEVMLVRLPTEEELAKGK